MVTPKSEQPQKRKTSIMFKSITLLITSAAVAALFTVQAEASEHPSADHAKTSKSAPNDDQIAQIVLSANTVDVDYGKLAVEKTTNPEVKKFAEMMVRDHSAVNEKIHALAKKLNATPMTSDASKSLETNGEKKLAELKALDSAGFDKAYIDNEVSYHSTVIEVLDTTLIPNAKNEELKSLLESARPIFVSHLDHAKQIQKSLTPQKSEHPTSEHPK